MKISDQTSISMPMRNLLSILGATALGVWAYFGVIERLNNIETRQTLFEEDLVKGADQTPIDQEQFMLLEFVSGQVEGMAEDLESYRYPEAIEGKDLKPEPLKDGYHDHGCDQLRYFFINHFPIKNREIISNRIRSI